MAKVGILGGTFDPIHNGHLILAQEALEAFGLDKILLIPTGLSYFKEGTGVTDPMVRLEMTREAAKDNPRFEVSDIEAIRPGNTYTADTLAELKKNNPEDSYYYIVGADTLVMMSLWRNPQAIFEKAAIIAAGREEQVAAEGLADEIRKLQEKYDVTILPLAARQIDISSTDIRKRCREGKSIRYLVPDAVRWYIEQKGLYRNGTDGGSQ